MHRKTACAAAIAAALMVAACSERHAEPANIATADAGAAADAIRAEEAQWNRDYAARDVDRILTHYAADATLMGPGSMPQTGTAAIRAAVAQMVGDPAFRLEFGNDRVEVAGSGDVGYTRGHFALTLTDPRTRRPGTMSGAYLTVWRKQADGSWKAVEDMITPGPAA